MKPAKLVEACTTQRELTDLAYAVMDQLGPTDAAKCLRECFFVSGTREQTEKILAALSDVNVASFDESERA